MKTPITLTQLRRITATAGIAILGASSLVVLGTAGAVGAQTYPSAGTATFSDATPEPGQTLAVSGNAAAGTTVNITLTRPDGSIVTLGTATADASGSFSLNITLPAGLGNGSYVIAAVNGSTVLSSSAFVVSSATAQGESTPTQTGAEAAANGGSGAAPAQAAPTTLPVTGNESGLLIWGGAGFVALGGAALVISKVRPDAEPMKP